MSVNPWIELSNEEAGLFLLAGDPVTNYNVLLYGKALFARREGKTVFFIDNHGILNLNKLKEDFKNDKALLEGFFVFSPKNLVELITTIDDLDLQYFATASQPVIFISGIFEFLIKNPTNTKNLSLLTYGLGLLRQFTVPVFVTNEMRATEDFDVPFLPYLLKPFFSKAFIVEMSKTKTEILEYLF